MGVLWPGLHRGRGLRGRRPGRAGAHGAVDPGRRCTALLLRRRHDGRDRLSARHLAGRVAPAGLAGGLRRRAGCRRRSRTAGAAGGRHPAGEGSLRLPGQRRPRAGRHHPAPAGRLGGGSGRGERRREVDPGQAAGQDVRAHSRADPGRLRPAAPDSARAWRDRLAGAFQDFFRFELIAQHSVGVGDLPHLDDRAGGLLRGGSGRRRGRGAATAGGTGEPAGCRLGRRTGAELRPVAEGGPVPRLHARRAAADDPRRADGRLGRRDRARPLRALRRRGPPYLGRWHHRAGVTPVQHGADGRSHRGPRRRPAGRGRVTTTSCCVGAVPMPSCTASRPRPTSSRVESG